MNRLTRFTEWLLVLLTIALAATLRLANVADTPGWYTDEGTHLAIALSSRIVQGPSGGVRYLAITDSTLLFAKLPGFECLLALALRLWPNGMATLRTLTGSLGVLTIVTLYGVTRHITRDRVLALLAALLLALYPQAVLYSRFGFSYNLLGPLVLLTFWALWQALDQGPGWLIAAGLIIGLGGICDLWMFVLLVPLLVVGALCCGRARRPCWQPLLASLVLAVLPFAIYALVMHLHAPQAFWFDLRFTLTRLSGVPLTTQLSKLARNYTVLLTQDPWLALALVGVGVGLSAQRPSSVRLSTLTLFFLLIPIVALGRTEALYNLSAYYTIPLFPFIALGVAILLCQGIPYLWREISRAVAKGLAQWPWLAHTGHTPRVTTAALWGAGLLLAALTLTPFVTLVAHTVQQVHTHIPTIIDPFLLNPADARAAADFVNDLVPTRLAPDAVVLASPGMAWQLHLPTADFQMAANAAGYATPHLPRNLPPSRYAFDPRLANAQCVIVDNLWHTWAVWNVPGVDAMLAEVQTWPEVFRTGKIIVYCQSSYHP
jgi:4-amino-4-deoxy-L-arabinose transferase-like glycosyltransferase